MKKFLSLMVLSLIPAFAYSDCLNRACTNVTIENLYITSTSNIIVETSGDESKLNCSGTGGLYFTLSTDAKNAEFIFSALLTAVAANKSVQVNTYDNSDGCMIERVEIRPN